MKKESRKDIHQIIKDKFGTNKLKDEQFTNKKYKEWSDETEVFNLENVPEPSEQTNDNDEKLEFIVSHAKVLSENERLVLNLFSNNQSLSQIAEQLKITKATVQVYLNRAKEKILEAWRNEHDE